VLLGVHCAVVSSAAVPVVVDQTKLNALRFSSFCHSRFYLFIYLWFVHSKWRTV